MFVDSMKISVFTRYHPQKGMANRKLLGKGETSTNQLVFWFQNVSFGGCIPLGPIPSHDGRSG